MSNSNQHDITKGLGELLITDVFLKHGITEQKTRTLSPEQRAHVRSLVQDLQAQVEQFIHQTEQQKPVITPASSSQAETGETPRPRRRLTLKKKSDD